jgi:hypothetical protein
MSILALRSLRNDGGGAAALEKLTSGFENEDPDLKVGTALKVSLKKQKNCGRKLKTTRIKL